MIVFLLIKLSRFSISFFVSLRHLLDYSGYTSSSLRNSSWNSPSSTDEENLSDNEFYQQKKSFIPFTNGHSMTNGYVQYDKSERSRSCENSLDSCGQKSADELTLSSSSLIDLPISSISHADYDNLATVNDQPDTNGQASISKSSISSELDQKTKDAIDAKLKAIDDEFELNCKNVL